MNVIIDRVTFIRSLADAGAVVDSNIGSLDSWARYRFDAAGDTVSASGAGRLSFFTLWHNLRTDPVIMTAGAVSSSTRTFRSTRTGTGSRLASSPTPRHAPRSDRSLSSATANGGFVGGDDSASIAFDEFPNTSGVSVPAQSWALIEISLLTEWTTLDGAVLLDAQSGSFKLSVPWLILTIT